MGKRRLSGEEKNAKCITGKRASVTGTAGSNYSVQLRKWFFLSLKQGIEM